MLFHTPAFILGFLPVCVAGFFLAGQVAGRTAALGWLIAANLFFYGWWNPPFTLLLIGSVAGNYLLGQRIRCLALAARGSEDPAPFSRSGDLHRGTEAPARAARLWLIAAIAANLLLLAWFKYADFLLSIVAPDQPALGIFLPLAISFFTFQQIMYLVDCHRAPESAAGPLSYAAFVTFFPHLIAGPLVAPREIIPQFRHLSSPVPHNLSVGLSLFLLGLGKKLVLADTIGGFADVGFDAAGRGETLSFFEAWYATLAYALQIYFDFSGYSDMAIGLARMFNIRFPLNFNSPYQARSISDFWRRWHITLGLFLRDYVFIPLGGSRHGMPRTLAALMVTMLLGGLWHGAAWRFVVWGGLHGVFLAVHAAWRRIGPPLPGVLARGLTLLAVVLAWVPFRAADLPTAWHMTRSLAGLNGIALPQMIISAVPALGAIATPVPVLPFLGDARTLSFPEVTACLLLGWIIVLALPHLHLWRPPARAWGLTAGFALTVQALFFAPNVAPFLYFQF
ncbi:MAG: MBOAT family protein [Acetobacteraceae bacterium]